MGGVTTRPTAAEHMYSVASNGRKGAEGKEKKERTERKQRVRVLD